MTSPADVVAVGREETESAALPRLPPPLAAGDRVGIAALSGPVDERRLAAGIVLLEQLGFAPVPAGNLAARSAEGLFAGGDDERLDAFHELVADETIRGILFARGGHGILRLLPRLDWDLLARRPLAYVGYSDLTPFLLQVVERLGLVAFHGPMVAVELARGLEESERSSLVAALAGAYPCRWPVRIAKRRRSELAEPASGLLVGGCLSMLVATLGTAYFPRLRGRMLFLEDANEPLYRLDRMLTHLRLSGNLPNLRGLLLGQLAPDPDDSEGWRQVLETATRDYAWPVASDLPVGHTEPNLTLPLGLVAHLDEQDASLILG